MAQSLSKSSDLVAGDGIWWHPQRSVGGGVESSAPVTEVHHVRKLNAHQHPKEEEMCPQPLLTTPAIFLPFLALMVAQIWRG